MKIFGRQPYVKTEGGVAENCHIVYNQTEARLGQFFE